MTPEQKQSFYDDGFLIFRDIIPTETVRVAARQLYGDLSAVWQSSMAVARQSDEPNETAIALHRTASLAATKTGVSPAILNLVDPDSTLMQSIFEALGQRTRRPQGAQLATIFPNQPHAGINESGYPSSEVPFFGWHGHLDGLWNGASPVHQRTDRAMNDEERAAWFQDPGRNGVRRTYKGTNVLNFTALLGIPLSDQMVEGSGNLGLLRGAHHPMSEFFRFQRDKGGPLGPDGPDWERMDSTCPNRAGLRHYPDQVRQQFKEDGAYTSDGQLWPKPTLIKVRPGDAVIALHAIPHCSTRLEGVSPRLMAYYRLVAENRPAENPTVFPDALCDCWFDWKGMREVVKDNQASS